MFLAACGSRKNIVDVRVKPFPIIGRISKKYVDRNNHGFQTIVVNNNGFVLKFTLIECDSRTTNLYDFVEVGDSIVKASNSLKFMIIRKNQRYTKDIKCDD